jgi:transcriptional regulator with XRE-family HTH domain
MIYLSMSITHTFGHKVRYFRNLKRLSQEELAELCGLHRTYIGSIERGERNITLINAEKIACALGQHLASFFKEESETHQ